MYGLFSGRIFSIFFQKKCLTKHGGNENCALEKETGEQKSLEENSFTLLLSENMLIKRGRKMEKS